MMKKRILVVDDDNMNLMRTRVILGYVNANMKL